MKNLFFAVALLLLVSCNKDDESAKTEIVIKGTLPSAQAKSTVTDTIILLPYAKKVLVFSKDYYQLYDIVDGKFSVNAKIGSGVALLFLDADNKYMGNLSSRGLNILPLGNLKDGENTSIDLSTLTLSGTDVIPSHDPFGKEIIISDTEINCLKVIGTFYESIAENLDTDNNGVPDVLTNEQLYTATLFARYSGQWGLNAEAPVLSDESDTYINYSLIINGGTGLSVSNGNMSLSGPAGNPYPAITTWGANTTDDGFESTFVVQAQAPEGAPWGTAFLPFQPGTYTLTLSDNSTHALAYSNLDANINLTIICPTLHTDGNGKLTSITLEYKLPDGTLINPASIISGVTIQYVDSQYNKFMDDSHLNPETGFTEVTFSTPVDISILTQMDIWYDDILGNTYDIIWR